MRDVKQVDEKPASKSDPKPASKSDAKDALPKVTKPRTDGGPTRVAIRLGVLLLAFASPGLTGCNKKAEPAEADEKKADTGDAKAEPAKPAKAPAKAAAK